MFTGKFTEDYFKKVDEAQRSIAGVTEENFDETVEFLITLDPLMVLSEIGTIAKSRFFNEQLYAKLFAVVAQKTKTEINAKLIRNYDGPFLRMLYENGLFSLDFALNNLYAISIEAFADIVPDYYSWATVDLGELKVTKEWVLNRVYPATLLSTLRNDNIDDLLERAKNPAFDINQRAQVGYFEQFAVRRLITSIIDYAALMGATKCFRYLFSCKAKVTQKTMNCACAGGCIESIRLCQQAGLSLKGTAEYASKFYHYDVLDWLNDINGEWTPCARCMSNVLENPVMDQLESLDIDPYAALYLTLNFWPNSTGKMFFGEFLDRIPLQDAIDVVKAMLDNGMNFSKIADASIARNPEFLDWAATVVDPMRHSSAFGPYFLAHPAEGDDLPVQLNAFEAVTRENAGRVMPTNSFLAYCVLHGLDDVITEVPRPICIDTLPYTAELCLKEPAKYSFQLVSVCSPQLILNLARSGAKLTGEGFRSLSIMLALALNGYADFYEFPTMDIGPILAEFIESYRKTHKNNNK